MKQQNEFNSEHEQEHAVEHKLEQKQGYEFASTDELLRFDAAHTSVPAGIAQRLKESTEGLPPPPRSWWQRLFKS
jgi:hypothetical protein